MSAEQLTLFEESESVLIPKDVVSPLETNKGVKSKEFKKQQNRWSKYVKAVQDHRNCSWFEARKLLTEHRDKQEPIQLRGIEDV